MELAPPRSLIGDLLAALAIEFKPENFMQARRLISHANEDGSSCGNCESGKSIGYCGLCFECANNALFAATHGVRAPQHALR